MRDWNTLSTSTTMRQLLEAFNENTYSSQFMDYIVGNIMCNGLLYTGNESINEQPIKPLTKVGLTGIVNSDTSFDNFRMYFRKDNVIIELNQLSVDLTAYNDGAPHFLYFKQDKSYRVSDYMFGQVDEVLICRFIISTTSQWQQLYIVAPRAGAPLYSTSEEFYTLNGIYVKSPTGLQLSHTDGTIKRSGIEFSDNYCPDLYRDTSTISTKVPIRYTNLYNKVDYSTDAVYDIDSTHYMTYDNNYKLKSRAQEKIRETLNKIYELNGLANSVATSLSTLLSTPNTTQDDYKVIVNNLLSYYNTVYLYTASVCSFISDNSSYFSNINLTPLNTNISDWNTYVTANFSGDITTSSVTAIQNSVYYLFTGNSTVYANPLVTLLNNVYSIINAYTSSRGTLSTVATGKFTCQRILWDIYSNEFIVQYGDTVYDAVQDATATIGEMYYPVPFGRLVYIPLAVLVVKSGITDINTDSDTIIVTKQVLYADSEDSDTTDFIARSAAEKSLKYVLGVLDGSSVANKAANLSYTDNGTTKYATGDYFLNYDNLRNTVTVINALTENTANSKHALSAYQGYVLNNSKLNISGGTLTGALKGQTIQPITNNLYDLGTTDYKWRTLYATGLNITGNATISGTLNTNSVTSTSGTIHGNLLVTGGITTGDSRRYLISGATTTTPTVTRIEADSITNVNSKWSSYGNQTVALCW